MGMDFLRRSKQKPAEPEAEALTKEDEILAFTLRQFGHRTLKDIAVKLGEETGEVLGAVTKLEEDRATLEDFDAEVGDVLIVLSQFAGWRGKTLDEMREARFQTIQERHQAADLPS